MKLKKFLAAAMVSTLALGAVAAPVTPVILAYADDAAASKVNTKITITPKYDSYSATITTANEGENYIFLEVLKKKSETEYKVSATYCYSVDTLKENEKGVEVDLSFLKATTKQYIRAYGSLDMTSDAKYTAVTEIKAQPAKSKLKFAEAQTEVGKAFKNGDAELGDKVANYSYRTLYGTVWNELSKLNLANTTVAGTTLIVREDATADAPAGAEAKVKVKAIAKAPKVTVDYVKNTIPLKKDTQYRIITTGEGAIDDATKWVDVTAATKNSPEKIVTDYLAKIKDTKTKATDVVAGGFTLVVRTVKSDKAPSAAAFVGVIAAPTIKQTDNANEIKVSEDNKLTWTNDKEGVNFVATSKDFAYSLDSGKTWKAIKDNEDGVLVKFDRTAEQKILVRTVGVKAKGDVEAAFPSNSVELVVAARTEAATPEQSSVTVERTAETTITVKATVEGLEYSLDNSEWTALTKDEVETLTEQSAEAFKVYVRVAETADKLASKALEVNVAVYTAPSGK